MRHSALDAQRLQARQVGQLGKELYERLAAAAASLKKLGNRLHGAVGDYNAFVGSFESQVLTQAKRFEALDVETGDREIPALPVAEQAARPLAKLSGAGGAND